MDDYLTLLSVPAITAVVYWAITVIKYTTKDNEKVLRFVPLMAVILGIGAGVGCFYALPNVLPTDNVWLACVMGGASGLSATGFNQILKQFTKKSVSEQTDTKSPCADTETDDTDGADISTTDANVNVDKNNTEKPE